MAATLATPVQPPPPALHSQPHHNRDLQMEFLGTEVSDSPVPAMFADQTLDLVISSVIFFFTIMQQTELQKKSIHIIAILAGMFAVYAILSAISDNLKTLLARGSVRRYWVARMLVRLLYFVMAFVSGLFVRLISDPIVRGAQVGAFILLSLLWPFVILVVLVSYIAYLKLVAQQNTQLERRLVDEHNAINKEIAALQQRHHDSSTPTL